jgi:hypothetical protein
MAMKLQAVRTHALSLEAVTEAPHHHFSSFRVRGKIFVTVPPGEQFIHVFLDDDDREQALAMYPSFTQKLLWGGKVVGLRVQLDLAAPAAVRALLGQAYRTRVNKEAGPRRAGQA